MRSIGSILLFVFMCSMVEAVVYVDHLVTDCADYNPSSRECGTGSQQAYDSISDSISQDRHVFIRAGSFPESLDISEDGVTLEAFQGETVTISSSSTALEISGEDNTVVGIIFDGLWSNSDIIRLSDGAHRTHLENIEVMNTRRDCIDIGGPDDVVISGARIHDCINVQGSSREDAHGIVTTGVQDMVIRDTEIYYVTGDTLQFQYDGWDNILVENCRLWNGPLPSARGGAPAGVYPGENAIDTKYEIADGRGRLTMRNITAHGWRSDYINNAAAFNIKHNVEVILDGITAWDNEICFRLRGPGDRGGAHVTVMNAIMYDSDKGIRYEDGIENMKIYNNVFGADIDTFFQSAGGHGSGFDVRNNLFIGSKPSEASDGSNHAVDADNFADVAAGDYHPINPIDGDDISIVELDRDGRTRPDDIAAGAYESGLYVDNDVGSDSGTGSYDDPFETIRAAVDAAENGDLILVRDTGIGYAGVCVMIDDITLIGIEGKPVIDEYVSCDSRNSMLFSRADDVHFENFILDATDHSCVHIRALIFSGLPDDPIFRNSARYIDARGPGQGCSGRSLISSSLCYDCILEDSSSVGAEEHGIYWTNHQDGSIIRNNYVEDADGACLQLNSDPETYNPGHPYQDGIMSDNLVEGNIFYNCGTANGAALNLAGVHDSIFQNNLIYGSSLTGGIASWDDGYSSWGDSGNYAFGCKDNQYYHNTIDCRGCDRHAMSFRNGGTGNRFMNNIVLTSDDDAIAIDSESDSGNSIDYNIYLTDVFFEDTSENFILFSEWQVLGHDSHSATADLEDIFYSIGDYRLKSDSPAEDSGINLGVMNDIEGSSRPQGNGYDIGAYEAQGDCTPTTATDFMLLVNGWIAGTYNMEQILGVIVSWKNGC